MVRQRWLVDEAFRRRTEQVRLACAITRGAGQDGIPFHDARAPTVPAHEEPLEGLDAEAPLPEPQVGYPCQGPAPALDRAGVAECPPLGGNSSHAGQSDRSSDQSGHVEVTLKPRGVATEWWLLRARNNRTHVLHITTAPVHQPPPLCWQVRSCVGLLDANSDIVSEAQFHDGVRSVSAFRSPVSETAAESVHGRAPGESGRPQ